MTLLKIIILLASLWILIEYNRFPEFPRPRIAKFIIILTVNAALYCERNLLFMLLLHPHFLFFGQLFCVLIWRAMQAINGLK